MSSCPLMQNRMPKHGQAPPNTWQHQQPSEVQRQSLTLDLYERATKKCSQGAAESHRTLVRQECAVPLLCPTYPSVCNQLSSTATEANKQNLTKHPPCFAVKWRNHWQQWVIKEGDQVSSAWTTEQTWLDSWPGQEIQLFSRTSRPALGSTQPPLQ